MKREDFSLQWQFAAAEAGCTATPPDEAFVPVDLPHDAQIRHANDLYRDGNLFYRKRFSVTPVPGRRIALWFGGAYMDTTVYVNGEEAGQWKNGYTSFWLDITGHLRDGENEVLVRCVLLHPNSRWYSGAGLFRGVELWEMPACHLMPDGLYVAAREGENGRWQVQASAEIGCCGEKAADGSVELRLTAPDGTLVKSRTVDAVDWKPCEADAAWRTGTETDIRRAETEFTLQDPAL